MPLHLQDFFALLGHQDGVLVKVHAVQGSGPREQGAWMAVFDNTVVNTIGGGHLELQAIERARAWLKSPDQFPSGANAPAQLVRFALGPSLGQCCGGVVHLAFDRVGIADLPRLRVELTPPMHALGLFGGGHVGRALVKLLADLPFAVRWVDSRDEIFPSQIPQNVVCEHSHPVQAAVADLPPNAAVLIMSFSHAEDLDVVAACLQRQRQHKDLGLIGLIGTKTKWASFRKRLSQLGFTEHELTQVTCPIGVGGIPGKAPEVVALAIAAQLLQVCASAPAPT